MSLDDVQLHLVDSVDEAFALMRWLGQSRYRNTLGVDSETTGLNTRTDNLRLVQVGDAGAGWAIPWERWGGVFEEVVRKWDGDWVLHNAPFDDAFFRREGIELPRHKIHDTMPMCHVLEPTHSAALKNATARFVDARAGSMQQALDEAIGSRGGWTWATVPVTMTEYWTYGALDPVLACRLFENRIEALEADGSYKAYELENAVQWVLQRMSQRGAHVDRAFARERATAFSAYCENVAQWVKNQYNVSPGSDVEIIKVLQEEGYEFSKRTKSGTRYALDSEVLEGLDHPLAEAVLNRRRLVKIVSTYLMHVVNEADADDLIHPQIRSLGARTGRMSMAEPNLQNLPRASENNPRATTVRNCYTTRYGRDGTLVLCDFDQIEMRGLAHMSQDSGLREAFLSPGDFFVNLARRVYRDETIDKKHPLRQRVKNVGYAKIYGAGIRKMAITAGISEEEMAPSVHAFDAEFPGVRVFQNRVQRTALDRRNAEGVGYVRSPLTHRRHPSDDGKEYALVNYLVQGLAAEIFKMKILELDAAGLGEYMILPVHDEIIMDVPNDDLPRVIDTLKTVMNDEQLLTVPVTAGIAVGERWGEKREWVDTD